MPSTLHSTFHLARFELLRIARVPTVMGYFLGPLLLYPALIWGELQVFSLMEGERATEVYRIAVDDPELAELLADVERLVSFGTRHTASRTDSETEGIGAARRWLEAAAALGYAPALQELALKEPDPRQAELLMRQAAHALQHRPALD